MEILSIENLIDDKKCYEKVRKLRWRENEVKCPHCNASEIIKRGKGRRRRLKHARGRGTLEKEKPPVFGMIQQSGEVVIQMLKNVKELTTMPIITKTIEIGSEVFTDEYSIYQNLPDHGYCHKTVCHSKGEYARDEDEDGFCEVHSNTMEGFWSLLRSWLRPHRGISQEKLPLYLGFFEFVHNMRKKGKILLKSLLATILTKKTPKHI